MRTLISIACLILSLVLLGALAIKAASTSKAAAQPASAPRQALSITIPAAFLRQSIPDTRSNADTLRRGRYLVIAGDCMSCHLSAGGEPFAGGLALNTPFGTIYSSNITSDPESGIGAWTTEQFYRAMHDGIGVKGENLYPAFPYPWFRRFSRADTDAILAYLKTTPAVIYTPPANDLHFPLNIRATVKGWNLLYLEGGEYKADPTQSAQWNRGAYLVKGPGHCSGCHTPKGRLGADLAAQSFYGGTLDHWVAPDLTPNVRSGLGGWGLEDISEYLKTGRNIHAGAAGAMADVVTYSTSLLTDADRDAIAVYLRTLSPSPAQTGVAPSAGAMSRGAAIYSDVCASCHLENGIGQPRYFPPLGHNAIVQQPQATGLEHLILAGGRIGSTSSRPSPLTMPSFAWKLSDQEIADVATYIRNSWGNQAPTVPSSEIAQLRNRLGLDIRRPTANSGDWH
jgi:mono/diheme cytochrome c family protein